MSTKQQELIKTINGLGRDLEGAARQLRALAAEMEVGQNVADASVAAEIITNLLGNIRLDKLVRLPFEIELEKNRMASASEPQ